MFDFIVMDPKVLIEACPAMNAKVKALSLLVRLVRVMS